MRTLQKSVETARKFAWQKQEQHARRNALRQLFFTFWARVAQMPEDERIELAARYGIRTVGGDSLSPCNAALCILQNPKISTVASSRAWIDRDRAVRQGERGMMIWIPVWEFARLDEDLQNPDAVNNENWLTIGMVFDISQTAPLPGSHRILPRTEPPYLQFQGGLVSDAVGASNEKSTIPKIETQTETRTERINPPSVPRFKETSAILPEGFALDMSKVDAIREETKEVAEILSAVMQDGPETSTSLPKTPAVPLPEISAVSIRPSASALLTPFNGLDVAFHRVLERLLTRDSWPRPDFDLLAREFHFMPLSILDTLNEWADEALGDFILEGDDPVVVRRELVTKERM